MISKDIIRRARQANLVAYLESKNYSFKQEGNRYRCKQHDSLIITNKNAYFWNSKNDSGNAIDFLVKHLNMGFKTAVTELTNTNLDREKLLTETKTVRSDYVVTKDYLNRAYGYLNKKRYIENTIITNLIEKGYLRMITGPSYKHPNIGFTILDENKQILGYELQGTLDKIRFKGVTSDIIATNFGFNIQIGTSKPKKAFFFESAIDLLSFFQLCKNNVLNVPLNSSILVSMAGLKVNTLCNTLSTFKIDSKACYVCVDSDKAGTNFKTALKNQNIKFREILVPKCKDWNEYLQYVERA